MDAGELGAAVEEIEFDSEGGAGDFAAKLANQFDCGRGSAAGGKQVVAKKDVLSRFYRVGVDFERIARVFELVGD